MRRKRKADNQPKEQPLKKKVSPSKKKTSSAAIEVLSDDMRVDIDSGDESDGETALRQVEAREEPRAARRGPGNASMQHFHDPTAIVDRSGQKRWEFRCRLCTWYVKFYMKTAVGLHQVKQYAQLPENCWRHRYNIRYGTKAAEAAKPSGAHNRV